MLADFTDDAHLTLAELNGPSSTLQLSLRDRLGDGSSRSSHSLTVAPNGASDSSWLFAALGWPFASARIAGHWSQPMNSNDRPEADTLELGRTSARVDCRLMNHLCPRATAPRCRFARSI